MVVFGIKPDTALLTVAIDDMLLAHRNSVFIAMRKHIASPNTYIEVETMVRHSVHDFHHIELGRQIYGVIACAHFIVGYTLCPLHNTLTVLSVGILWKTNRFQIIKSLLPVETGPVIIEAQTCQVVYIKRDSNAKFREHVHKRCRVYIIHSQAVHACNTSLGVKTPEKGTASIPFHLFLRPGYMGQAGKRYS